MYIETHGIIQIRKSENVSSPLNIMLNNCPNRMWATEYSALSPHQEILATSWRGSLGNTLNSSLQFRQRTLCCDTDFLIPNHWPAEHKRHTACCATFFWTANSSKQRLSKQCYKNSSSCDTYDSYIFLMYLYSHKSYLKKKKTPW